MTFTMAGIEMSVGGVAVASAWPVGLLVLLVVARLVEPVGAVVGHRLMAAGEWLSHLTPVGGHAGRVLAYDWRYLDGAEHDITDQVHNAGMVAVAAEAVAESGQVLLLVRRRDEGWQIAGGHLGDQVDGATFATIYGDPYAAMAAAARQLGMTAQER